MIRIILALSLAKSIVCSAQEPSVVTSDHVRIEHSGPIDKPIIPLVITMKELKLPVTELPILVSEAVFSSVAEYIRDNEDVAPKKLINEFGVFKITEFLSGEKKVCFTKSRVNSIQFLKKLKSKLANQKSAGRLTKEIDHLLSRIDWPKK